AKWTYDTLQKGQLTSSTRYVNGAAYTTATDAFSDRYQPTSTTATIPSAAGGLAGTYTWTYGYNPETGALLWTLNPAVGDIPSERVTTNYNSDDLPFRVSGQRGVLVANTLYDVFSRPSRLEFGATVGQKAYQTRLYDEHTGRVTQQITDRDLAPQRVDDTSYSYDPAGNVTGVTTVSGQDAQKSTDTQCFTNDLLGRLTEAWTAKTDCTADPSAATVGGPDAYWQSYGYDKLGNRTSQTEHATTTTGTDATTTYTHPEPGTGLPHGVQQAKVNGGPDNGRISAFEYDETGNTTKRTIGTTTQDLTWDAEGHLATLTEAGKTSSYTYDADGNRLIAKNADGSSTLTLPNGDELTLAANGTKTGTRYYAHNGETVAVRTGATISYLISDHQGTAMTAITAGTLAITRRKQLPYGQLRSQQSTAFGTRGYVGGTNDPTGLTHLGAREYDPTLGRFLSIDPIIDTNDPAQMNAYSYAHNNPLTKSDPDGLRPDGPAGGASYNDDRWAEDRGMNAGYTYRSGKWVWHQTPKSWFDPRYQAYRANPSTYHVYHYNAKQVAADKAQAGARADKAKADADKERRRKDGILGSVKQGNWKNAWENTKEASKGAYSYVMTYTNTAGLCLSGSGSAGIGGEATGCIIWTNRPDGKTDFGLSGTLEEQAGAGLGGGITLGFPRSNADDFEQLRGAGAGFGGSAGMGIGAAVNHRGTFGTRNARGDIVHTYTAGVGGTAGVEGNFGSGTTGITKLFTW
ncbi:MULTISPECIES: RHS repeat-associated core domain-containing protein, partial [unclassified Streptomyces]|uniref:RHS repeat-associated core domain-containing protein n=1 Tax=unclassified Streptomyces TaxID=2593676 RepID=UPI0029A94FAC